MIGVGLHGLGRRRDLLVLAYLLGVFGIRRGGKRESRYEDGSKNLEGKRQHSGLHRKSGCLSLNELPCVRKVNGTSSRSQVGVGIFA